MGYGGSLIFSGLARNLRERFPKRQTVFIYRPRWREYLFGKNPTRDFAIFAGNPDIALVASTLAWQWQKRRFDPHQTTIVNLDDPRYFYWTKSTSKRVVYKTGRHAIQIACDVHGIDRATLQPRIVLSAAEQARAAQLLRDHHLAARQYVCIEPHTKASFTSNRQWFWDRWQKVAEGLHEYVRHAQPQVRLVQIGARTNDILPHCLNLTGQVSFRETADILASALFFVSTEGGLVHLARAVATPSAVLLSAMLQPEVFAYPQNRNLVADAAVCPCRGLKTPCRNGRRCMQTITVDRVLQACLALLARRLKP